MTTVTGDTTREKNMSKKSRARRDNLSLSLNHIPTRQRAPALRVSVSYKTNISALQQVEDRRTFYPGLVRPVVSISVGRPARLVMKQNPRYNAPSQTKGIVAFAEPHRLAVCIRRHQREQVLHALGVAGSKKPQKKPRRNEASAISCK